MKYILITFSGIIVVCLGLVVLVIGILDDDDYRELASRAVTHFTGYEMIIEGDFTLDISRVSTLSASKVRFKSPPGASPFPITHIGKINTKLALLPLITGTVVIKELSIDDASVSWVVDYDGQDKDSSFQMDADIAIPVLENVSLQNIVVNLLGTDMKNIGMIKVRHFSIDDIRDMGPLFVKGAGGVNASDFTISGQLGAIANALNPSKPYPVELHLETADLAVDISGTVDDFVEGEGLNLHIAADVAELSNLLKLFDVECPELGSMKLKADIGGDIEAPRAADIYATISDGSTVELSATGTVNDLVSRKGLDIGIKASIANNPIIQMVLPDILSDVTNLEIKGSLRDQKEDYILEDITAYVSNDQGLELTTDGSLNFGNLESDFPLKAMDLNLQVKSKTTEAAQRFLVDFLPEMGPISATARLTGPVDRMALEDLDVVAGESLPLQVTSQGRIDWIPIDDNPVSGIDLNVSVRAERTELLASAFDIPLPELGTVSLDSRLLYSGEQLKIDNIDVRTSHAQGLVTGLTGNMGIDFKEAKKSSGKVDLELTVTAPNLGAAEPLLGTRFAPGMGPVQGYARITGTPQELSLENILVTAGEPTSTFTKAYGRVDRIALGEEQPVSGLEISGLLQAKETADYVSLMGAEIPKLGPLEASWRLGNWEGGFDIEDMEFVVGQKDAFHITCMGKIKSLSRRGKISFAGFDFDLRAEAPDISTVPALSDISMPDLGPLQAKARLVGTAETLSIKNLTLRAGPEERAAFMMKGGMLSIESPEMIPLNISFETYANPWVEQYTERSVSDDLKLSGAIKLTCLPDRYRVEEFKITTKGEKPLTLEANGIIKKTGNAFDSDLKVAAEAKDPAVIESMFGIPMPAFSPLKVKGQLKNNEKMAKFEGETHFGKTQFRTIVTHSDTKRLKLKITIKNSAPVVYLSDLGIYPAESEAQPDQKKKRWFPGARLFRRGSAEGVSPEKKAKPEPGQIFSDQPMPLEALKDLDLLLSLDIEKLVGKDTVINDLDFDLVLDNGRLRISPAKLGYAEGKFSVESILDLTKEKPEFNLKATAEDIDMDTLHAYTNMPAIIGGNLNLTVDLYSSGRSSREIASALTGEMGYAVENGRIRRDVEMLTADAFDTLTSLHKINKYQDLNCMTIRFVFEDGIGKSEIIFFDTPNVRTQGLGTIDLGSETLDIVLQPKPKKGLPGMSSAVRIEGPISKPSVRTMPFREAARLYGEIFAPYVFLPARGLGYLWYLMKNDKDEDSPCLNLKPVDNQ